MTNAPVRMMTLAAVLALAPLSSALAWDHSDPTGEEKAMISHALLDQGFQNWGEIKFDDGLWEVEDARGFDGRKVDVKLDGNFMVVEIDD